MLLLIPLLIAIAPHA